MTTATITKRALMPAVVVAAVMTSTAALAGVDDYVFEPVTTKFKMSAPAEIPLRLVRKTTGAPVSDAVIFAHRLDMAPDGMASMTAALEPLPPQEAGVYRFKTEFAMAGQWQLSLAAKIQGEHGTHKAMIQLRATE